MRKNIYEILDDFQNADNKVDRLYTLRVNATLAFKAVLQNAFHPNILWYRTEFPKFKVRNVPPGLGFNTIATELKRFYLFRKDNPELPETLTEKRKDEILLQMLESMEPREAQVMINMMLKDLKIEHLTYDLVREAFPELLPELPPVVVKKAKKEVDA